MGVSQLSITWGYGVINRSREATFDWDSFGASCVVRLHFSFDLLKHQSSTQMALKLLTSTLSQPKCRSSVLCQGERSREKVLRLRIQWRHPQCGGAVAARMALPRGQLEVGDWKGLEMFGQKEAFHCMCRQPCVHDRRGHWWDKRLITNFHASNSDSAKKNEVYLYSFFTVSCINM